MVSSSPRGGICRTGNKTATAAPILVEEEGEASAIPQQQQQHDNHRRSHSLCTGSFAAAQDDVTESPFVEKLEETTANLDRDENIARMLPLLDATDVPDFGDGRFVRNGHEGYFADPTHVDWIRRGNLLFSLTCSHELKPYELKLVRNIVNLSKFGRDEVEINGVQHFECANADELSRYSVVLVKSCYLLPGDVRLMTPELLASYSYQSKCQPEGTYHWPDAEPGTFRITKPIIPHVFSLTVQFTCSEVPPEPLQRLSAFLGLPVDRGLLMERTKRSKPPKQDNTRKAKSVLLYTSVPGGFLVNHLTAVVQAGIPSFVERILDNLGSLGMGEVHETTRKTRRYLRSLVLEKEQKQGQQRKEEENNNGEEGKDENRSQQEQQNYGACCCVPPWSDDAC